MILKIKLKEDTDDGGIYMIFNKVNEYRYVGLTSCFRLRFRSHLDDLSKGVHSNSLLQYDYNFYGPDAFEFKILEKVVGRGRDELRNREIVWMKRMDAHGRLGYNLAK